MLVGSMSHLFCQQPVAAMDAGLHGARRKRHATHMNLVRAEMDPRIGIPSTEHACLTAHPGTEETGLRVPVAGDRKPECLSCVTRPRSEPRITHRELAHRLQ
jgi:hypothetical protein